MIEPIDFDEWYKKGDVPWDTGRQDKHLELVIREQSITPCPTLELGAGTASDAIWLVQKGFEVTALDVSPTAIEIALKKASAAAVEVQFIAADMLKEDIPLVPFDFVFDRGYFHLLDDSEERSRLVEIVWKHLNPDGYWFSLIGSTDGPKLENGPPRRSALDVVSAVESRFEILFLKTIHFETNLPEDPRAWACLMRRRHDGQ